MRTTLQIEGMTCENCVKHARMALSDIPGVSNVQVNLATGLAEVIHEGSDLNAMISAVEEEGYDAKVVE